MDSAGLFGLVNSAEPRPGMMAPFGLMLLAIAFMPFIHKRWWEEHYPKIATGMGGITVCYYVFGLANPGRILHTAHEYVSFMALIGSLFVVAGGIHVQLKGQAKPRHNCLYLFLGALAANVIGTTGASMVLIRPWLRMNRRRLAAFHVVFFIFIVSNAGGCLTPVGDPPLFLGYLKGVPFWWMLRHGWAAWGLLVLALVAIFYAFDRRNFRRTLEDEANGQPDAAAWRFEGWHNLIFLGVILLAVFVRRPAGLGESMMILAALGAYGTTPKRLRAANDFSFGPLREVAWLFAGIFATMAPALDYLEAHAAQLGLDQPATFFWSTGALSSVLDNAPTYLTFLAAAMGRHHLELNQIPDVATFVELHGQELLAVSLGAVFFGAMTYIGNGPNFMVKSIADQAKVKTPTFFAYVFQYALPILLPLLLLISLLFFPS